MQNTKRTDGIVLLYIIILLPFFGINGINTVLGSIICDTWKIVSIILGIVLLFGYFGTMRLDAFLLLLLLYQVEVFAVTTQHQAFSFGILSEVLAMIILSLLIQNDAENIIYAISIIAIGAIIVNLISLIMMENTQDTIYFLGGKNRFPMFLVPASFCLLLRSTYKNGKITKGSVFLFVLGMLGILFGGSSTGIITALVSLLLLLFFRKRNMNRFLVLSIIIALNILLIFFFEFLEESTLWETFTGWFGKESTLTNRFSVWAAAKDSISSHWLLGTGRGTQLSYLDSYGYLWGGTEAHNLILEIMMEGGLIALIAYMFAFFCSIRSLNMRKLPHRLVFIALTALLINGFTESTNNSCWLVIFMALANNYSTEERSGLTTKNPSMPKESAKRVRGFWRLQGRQSG